MKQRIVNQADLRGLGRIVIALLFLGLVVSLTVSAGPEAGEEWDRKVDRAALVSQDEAINKFQSLAKKYSGDPREAAILIRLIEAQEVGANLEFRITHGGAPGKKGTVNPAKYLGRIQKMVDTCTYTIGKYANFPEMVRVYYARGYGYSELKNVPLAKRDYDFLTVKYPDTAWAVRANMALADFSTTDKDHKRAIFYMKRIEAKPNDSAYPLALYSLAWSYFNLFDVPTALSYIQRNILYYRAKRDRSEKKTLSVTERALWEHSLRDATTFYFEGVDKKHPDYTVEEALPSFRKLEDGPYLGNMMALFAKLLRSRDKMLELEEWKNRAIKEEPARPETLDIAITYFEYLSQRRLYGLFAGGLDSFVKLDKTETAQFRKNASYAAAQNLLLQAADTLQKSIAAERDAQKNLKLSGYLAQVYSSFAGIVEENDPRLLQVHYNLAETLFKIGQFEKATAEYKWVVDQWNKKSALKLADLRLKLLSSRYQSLSQEGKIAQNLKPAEIKGSASPVLGDLEKPMAEYVADVDAYLGEFGRQPVAFEDFEFDSDRLLYSQKQTNAAVTRLKRLIKDAPASKNAVAAASLILDTYVSNSSWVDLRDTAEVFLASPKLGDVAFKKRIERIPGDAYFKIIEAHYKKEAYPEVITESDRFLAKYGASVRAPEVLYLASVAAQKTKDAPKAKLYLTDLLTKFPANPNRSNALLSRAGLMEAEYNFDEAQADYESSLAKKPSAEVAQHFFLLNAISKSPKPINCANYAIDLRPGCEKHRAMAYLGQRLPALPDADLYRLSTSGPKENRAIWAAVALETGKKFSHKELLTLMGTLGNDWGELESFYSFALIPTINDRLPQKFVQAREELRSLGKLKPNSNALARRIELMKELENTAGKVVKLPWAQVKSTVLFQVAEAYKEFCGELAKLNAPKGSSAEELKAYQNSVAEILEPFRAKEKTIRDQATEISNAFVLNDLPARQTASKADPIDLALLDKTATPYPWSTLAVTGKQSPPEKLRALWVEAFKTKLWARLAYLLPELKEKEIVTEPSLSLLRAASLFAAGARHEAVAELDKARGDVAPDKKRPITLVLLSQYTHSASAEKAKALQNELTPEPGGKP